MSDRQHHRPIVLPPPPPHLRPPLRPARSLLTGAIRTLCLPFLVLLALLSASTVAQAVPGKPGKPEVIPFVVPNQGNAGAYFLVKWTHPTGGAANYYFVRSNHNLDGGGAYPSSTEGRFFKDSSSSLVRNRSHAMRVAGTDDQTLHNAGPWSDATTANSSPATVSASDITDTGATLTVSNLPATWWYEGDQSDAQCTKVNNGTSTATLTGLTPGTEYTYNVYYRDTCTEDADKAAHWDVKATFTTKGLSFSTTVSDQTYTRGTAIDTLTLPEATASTGTPTITYSLDKTLPAGLTFSATNRTITGTPSAAATSQTYTYTAAATGYASATLTFDIVVNNPSLSFSTTVSDQTYTKDAAINTLTLPTATGSGSPTITYALDCGTPAVPAGLTYTASNRQLSGTPTATGSASCTYTASATDYTSATRTFSITVSEQKTLSFSTTVTDQTYTRAAALNTLTLPTATASTGSPTITYSLDKTLPAGLSFNATNRTITGTPSAAATSQTYTYTAAATDYTSATLTFSIVVNNPALSFSTTVADQAYTKDTAITTLDLPAATTSVGSPSITYTLDCGSPTVPTGLTYTALNRQISGTPTATGSASCTYTASATDYTSATLTFSIGVNEPKTLSFSTTVADQTYIKGAAITTLTLPTATASSGSPTITYSLSPTPPNGLSFSATNRTITGTPSAAATSQTYTYTAAATDYTSATRTFSIEVVEPVTLTASEVEQTTATLTIANHTGSWWYQYTSPTGGTCSAEQTGTTADLTDLKPATSYTFAAYSDACSTVLATAQAFTTLDLTSKDVKQTTATLTIANHTGNWWYKANKAPDNTCKGPVSTNTTTLTGLTADTDYTYTVYDKANCNDADAIASHTFKTAPTPTAPTGGGGGGGGDNSGRSGAVEPSPVQGWWESPGNGAVVSGVDVIRGWSFAEARGVGIERVELLLDGQRTALIPCCSARADVTAQHPTLPRTNTGQSGWGITQNWNLVPAGSHTVQVIATSTQGRQWTSDQRTVTVVKPGGIEYATTFSLAEAAARLAGEQLVLDGVVIADATTEQEVNLRYAWQTAAQGVRLVASQTRTMAQAPAVGLRRLLASALAWLRPGTVGAAEGLTSFYEAPRSRARVASIGVIRGWAFPDDPDDTIETVTVQFDDYPPGGAPCCSTRLDVAGHFPGQANAELSGWGLVMNYGLLPEGDHTLTVQIATAAGVVLPPETHTITTARLGGYAYVDRFDLSLAEVELVGEEIILSGVEVRDSATQQTQEIEVRMQWSQTAQALVIVDTETLP